MDTTPGEQPHNNNDNAMSTEINFIVMTSSLSGCHPVHDHTTQHPFPCRQDISLVRTVHHCHKGDAPKGNCLPCTVHNDCSFLPRLPFRERRLPGYLGNPHVRDRCAQTQQPSPTHHGHSTDSSGREQRPAFPNHPVAMLVDPQAVERRSFVVTLLQWVYFNVLQVGNHMVVGPITDSPHKLLPSGLNHIIIPHVNDPIIREVERRNLG